MRKKELSNLYLNAVDENRRLNSEINETLEKLDKIKETNKKYKSRILELEEILTDMDQIKTEENFKRNEKSTEDRSIKKENAVPCRMGKDFNLSPVEQYAAKTIGEIVKLSVSAVSSLKRVAADASMDKINLILGHTEIAKMKILEVTNSDESLDNKKSSIDLYYESAAEYFEKVLNLK